MLGGYFLVASATTQTGKAEFLRVDQVVAADMSKVVKPRVRVDVRASKAIASRRRVQVASPFRTQVLWVQEAMALRELTIVIVPSRKSR